MGDWCWLFCSLQSSGFGVVVVATDMRWRCSAGGFIGSGEGLYANGCGVVVSVLLMGSRSVFAVVVWLAATIFGVVVELGC